MAAVANLDRRRRLRFVTSLALILLVTLHIGSGRSVYRGVVTVVAARSGRYTQDVFQSLGKSGEQLLESLTGRSVSLPPNRLLVDKGEVGVVLYRITSGWAYRFR